MPSLPSASRTGGASRARVPPCQVISGAVAIRLNCCEILRKMAATNNAWLCWACRGKKRMRIITKATAALAIALASAPAIAWEPTKPVEIVVAAGAGGASDQMARIMQAAIQKNGLMKQPMVVSLKGGASGAEALIYMKTGAGDPHKGLIAYSPIYRLPLSAKTPFNCPWPPP